MEKRLVFFHSLCYDNPSTTENKNKPSDWYSESLVR
nr:MAG TPA: hypothetical protein [Caudoviricetes sp.]